MHAAYPPGTRLRTDPMSKRWGLAATLALVAAAGTVVTLSARQDDRRPPATKAVPDAVADAQTPRPVPTDRPEQRKTEHDRSDMFDPKKPAPLTTAFTEQPEMGRETGFDFARDPLNAKHPFQTFEETMRDDVAAKPKVTATQHKLLEHRYNLT